MRFVKAFSVGLLAFLLSLFLSGLIATTIFNAILAKPGNLKSWLEESKIYDAGINEVLNKAKTAPDSSTLSQPEVQKVIKQTFTPEVARSTVEQVIDGTYHWLEGRVNKPDFQVDLTSLKISLAENAGNAAVERFNSLPVCTKAQARQISSDLDPFAIPCRPPGVTAANAKQTVMDQILHNQELLKDPVLTADTIKTGDHNQPFYQQAPQLPQAYQWLRKAPWIFGLASLLSIGGIVWLSTSYRHGLRRVAISLIVSGASLGVAAIVLTWLANKSISNKNVLRSDVSADLQSAVIALGKLVAGSINHVLLGFGIGFVALGTGTLLYLHFYRPKTSPTAKQLS